MFKNTVKIKCCYVPETPRSLFRNKKKKKKEDAFVKVKVKDGQKK